MYIAALNGSHNDNGNTAYLLNSILKKKAERGAKNGDNKRIQSGERC